MLKRFPAALVMLLGLALTAMPAAADDAAKEAADKGEKVDHAREVFEELIKTPDRGVPEELLKNCRAIAIFPHVIKAAVGVGGRHGKGIVVQRTSAGWSAPAFFSLTGGSWGLQIGAESADVVLFFMSDKSVASLLNSKFTLGAKAGVAAGPAGRTAEASTDLKLNSEIYSYARSKGLFAGISLEGARIAADNDDNAEYYGKAITAKQILIGGETPSLPESATRLRSVLP